MIMKYINLNEQYMRMQQEIDEEVKAVMRDCDFILGKKEQEFEKLFANYIGIDYVVGCSNGTAALQLVYMAYGIGKGDAVFCPDMTFIATIEPACLLGATPVFCDIRKDTYNICAESLEQQIKAVINEGKLTPKAIIAVDFLGNPADYDALREIASKYNLLLIEDAAQGIGGKYKGNKLGICGDVATTSFFPTKPLGCYGDGGAVLTKDKALDNRLRSLRVHGKGIDKYHNIEIGINSRLDTLQAAILNVKLKHLDDEIEMRKKKAEYYDNALRENFIVPFVEKQNISAYAQYVIIPKTEKRREYYIEKLKEANIPSLLYYPVPMHKLQVFEGINNYGENFVNTDWYAENAFGIPFSPYISKKEQDLVIDCLLSS